MNNTKPCSKCNQYLPIDLFKADKRLASGRASICKPCNAAQTLNYANQDREKVRASSRATYYKNPQKRIDNSSNWAKTHPEQRLIIEANYRANHREETQARSADWNSRNPERRARYKLERRARIENNGVYLILDKELAKLYSSPCFYCDASERIEADHIIPISKGGQHSVGNLIPACRSCNAEKGQKYLMEYLMYKRLVK